MDLNLTETSKGKPAALLGGHLFRLMATSKNSRTWRCTKKDCKARFTTSLETKEILHGMTNHRHSTTVDAASFANGMVNFVNKIIPSQVACLKYKTFASGMLPSNTYCHCGIANDTQAWRRP
ncbi:hypothetical protein ElyMa_003284400 [Elysia marginata]|uniref:FLYWCH-type domain-containing protein n=1 Tax=Elysia marginata TaxID=1093978 RepID=A0AAV4JAC2_9GAST|nr:hypothetical protein ElyMa_003284400 [Elysia marginata]